MSKLNSCVITLLTFFIPFMFYFNLGVTFNMSISDLILPIALLILIIFNKYESNIINKNNNSWQSGILYSLIFILVLTISLYIINLNGRVTDTIEPFICVIKIFINLVYFLLYLYLFNTNEKFEYKFIKIWNASAVVVSIMCIIGVALYKLGIDIGWTYYYRATGPFEDPNLAATFLLMSISISIIYNMKNYKKNIRMNVILELIAIMLTVSRGALIILAVVPIILIFINIFRSDISNLNKILKLVLLGSIFILILNVAMNNLIFGNILERLSSSGSLDEDARFSAWKIALKIWYLNPIMGCGIGQYVDYSKEIGESLGILAHNTYLNFLSEIGIIGLIAFIWKPLSILKDLILCKVSHYKESVVILFSFLSLLISFMILNLENFRGVWVYMAFSLYITCKWNGDGVKNE